MTDTTEVSDEERALMRERKIPVRFLNSEHGHEGTFELASAYDFRLSCTERERDALKERVERLEAALKPFDELLDRLYKGDGGDIIARLYDVRSFSDDAHVNNVCTYGMLRRAREALAGKKCARCDSTEIVTNLDGDDLCQKHADAWVRGEGAAQGGNDE